MERSLSYSPPPRSYRVLQMSQCAREHFSLLERVDPPDEIEPHARLPLHRPFRLYTTNNRVRDTCEAHRKSIKSDTLGGKSNNSELQ